MLYEPNCFSYYNNTNTRKQQKTGSSNTSDETTIGVPKFKFPCKGCNIVVQNNEALAHHQVTCLKLQVDPSKKSSFQCQARKLFLAEVTQPTTPAPEKTTALSQSPGPTYAAVVSPGPTMPPRIGENEQNNEAAAPATVTDVNEPEGQEDNGNPNPADPLLPQENSNCPLCKEDVMDGQEGLACERCNTWSHKLCLNMSDEEYTILKHS